MNILPIIVHDWDSSAKKDINFVNLCSLNMVEAQKEAKLIYDEFIFQIDMEIEHGKKTDPDSAEIRRLLAKLNTSSSNGVILPSDLRTKLNELEKVLRKKDSIKLTKAVNDALKDANKEKSEQIAKTANDLINEAHRYFGPLENKYILYQRRRLSDYTFIKMTDAVHFIQKVELDKITASYGGIINENDKKLNKEELENILSKINSLKQELLNIKSFKTDDILKCLEELTNIYEEFLAKEITILVKNDFEFLNKEYEELNYELLKAMLAKDTRKCQDTAVSYDRLNRFVKEDRIGLGISKNGIPGYLKDLQDETLKSATERLKEEGRIEANNVKEETKKEVKVSAITKKPINNIHNNTEELYNNIAKELNKIKSNHKNLDEKKFTKIKDLINELKMQKMSVYSDFMLGYRFLDLVTDTERNKFISLLNEAIDKANTKVISDAYGIVSNITDLINSLDIYPAEKVDLRKSLDALKENILTTLDSNFVYKPKKPEVYIPEDVRMRFKQIEIAIDRDTELNNNQRRIVNNFSKIKETYIKLGECETIFREVTHIKKYMPERTQLPCKKINDYLETLIKKYKSIERDYHVYLDGFDLNLFRDEMFYVVPKNILDEYEKLNFKLFAISAKKPIDEEEMNNLKKQIKMVEDNAVKEIKSTYGITRKSLERTVGTTVNDLLNSYNKALDSAKEAGIPIDYDNVYYHNYDKYTESISNPVYREYLETVASGESLEDATFHKYADKHGDVLLGIHVTHSDDEKRYQTLMYILVKTIMEEPKNEEKIKTICLLIQEIQDRNKDSKKFKTPDFMETLRKNGVEACKRAIEDLYNKGYVLNDGGLEEDSLINEPRNTNISDVCKEVNSEIDLDNGPFVSSRK